MRNLQAKKPKSDYSEFDPEGSWGLFMNFKRNGYNHGCPVHILISEGMEVVFHKRFRTIPELLKFTPAEEYAKEFNNARRACLAAAEEHRHKV